MKALSRVTSAVSSARERWGWLDHLVRAALRYKADSGDRLAASLTFYAFLSLFPLLLFGFSVLGFVLAGRQELQTEIVSRLVEEVPGLSDTFSENLDMIRENAGKTGVVALAGVLFAGLGGVNAARESLRLMWHQNPADGNFVKSKISSVVTLAGLGLTLLFSVALSTVASSALDAILHAAGIDAGPAGEVVAGALALAVALGADVLLFLYVFRRLPKVDWPFRRVLRGAVFAAVGFGALKFALTFYVARTVANNSRLYGPVGAVIGILVGVNVIARFVLFAAAWTVTAPGSDDVLPSATASPAAAAQAGGTASPTGPATDDPRFEPDRSDARAPDAAHRGRELATTGAIASAAAARLDPDTAARTRVAAGAALGVMATAGVMAVVGGLRALFGGTRSG